MASERIDLGDGYVMVIPKCISETSFELGWRRKREMRKQRIKCKIAEISFKNPRVKKCYDLGEGYHLNIFQSPEAIEEIEKESLIDISGNITWKRANVEKALCKFRKFAKTKLIFVAYSINICETVNQYPSFEFAGHIYKDW